MLESAEKLTERLDALEADLADARDERDRLERAAAEARAGGRNEDADAYIAELREARSRAENLASTVPLVREELDAAREAEAREAAERRVKELAALISTRLENAENARETATSRLPEAVELARDALEAEDDMRRLRLEIRLLCRVFGVKEPDLPEYDVEARDDLLGAVASAASELGAVARSFPLDATSGSHGHVLRRKLPGLIRGELAGRHLLTDATRELWADAHGGDREDGE